MGQPFFRLISIKTIAAAGLLTLILSTAPEVLRQQSLTLAQSRRIQHISPSSSSSVQEQPHRVALVIGNSNYAMSPLRNPANDANDVAKALRNLGFDPVITKTNASYREMGEAVKQFSSALQGSAVGVFYYAGHGIQLNGENYLIPVDAKIDVADNLKYDAVPLGEVLGYMNNAKNDVNIVILDACRNNPFARSWRSTSQGLAKVNQPFGTYIMYATAPDDVAQDGEGRNGTFTGALLQHIGTPGLSIESLYKKVLSDVRQLTENKQIPWASTSLAGDFSFNPTPETTETVLPQANVAARPAVLPTSVPTQSAAPPPKPTPSPVVSPPVVRPESTPRPTPSPPSLRPSIPPAPSSPINQPIVEAGIHQKVEEMYARLDSYAQQGNWRDADEQTYWLLNQIAEQTPFGNKDYEWLDAKEVDNFPCSELKRIDDIWLNRSNHHFGYRVQLEVIQAVGETPQSVYRSMQIDQNEAWRKFVVTVGWADKNNQGATYKADNALNFTIAAPKGHLPIPRGSWVLGSTASLPLRVLSCHLPTP